MSANSFHHRAVDRMAENTASLLIILGVLLFFFASLLAASASAREQLPLVVILYGIGSSLIATAVATLVVDASRDRLKATRQGLQRVYRRRSEVHEDEYKQFIEKARRRVWVQGIGLCRFIQRNAAALQEAALRGVDVRLLVLDCETRIALPNGAKVSFLDLRFLEEKNVELPKSGAGGMVDGHALVRHFVEDAHQAMVAERQVELTRYRGHPDIWEEKGVHDEREPQSVPAGVSAPDGGAGPCGTESRGAVTGVRADGASDPQLGTAGGS